jgi:hypothetical protein
MNTREDVTDQEWTTPETKLVAGIIERTPRWPDVVMGVARLYARNPGLCDATRGEYPPRFAWWLERWVWAGLTRWKRKHTQTQGNRRRLVEAALARVEWQALADHYAEREATVRAEGERRRGGVRGMAVPREREGRE